MSDGTTLTSIQDGLVSHSQALGVFDTVEDHAPATVPGAGIWCIWEVTVPFAHASSGLASTSAVLTWVATILAPLTTEPGGDIERDVLRAADALIRSLIGDFDLGGLVRYVDVRGSEGTPLRADAGYASVNGVRLRVVTVVVPLIVNDLYDETP
jgi:hypothetical protein